jgi:hypothetical protein
MGRYIKVNHNKKGWENVDWINVLPDREHGT